MIESPKNFIEQFQNFIEHIAGVMKTFLTKEVADSYYLGKSAQSLTPEQKSQVMQNLAGTFLPLTGGTITGTIKASNEIVIQSNVTNKAIHIRGGASTRDGAEFIVGGKDYLPDLGLQGFFRLCADDGVSEGRLEGLPNGSLKWNYKEVERVNAIGENYIRYESGLQLCWGKTFVPSGLVNTTVTLPVPYKDTSYTTHATYLDVQHTTVGATTENSSGTDFRVAVTNLAGAYDWDRYFVWSTIGRWK